MGHLQVSKWEQGEYSGAGREERMVMTRFRYSDSGNTGQFQGYSGCMKKKTGLRDNSGFRLCGSLCYSVELCVTKK
jgi:hypothetical protein